MRIGVATALVVCGIAGPARADGAFDAAAQSAVRVRHLEDIVWLFTTACAQGDLIQQRQCRLIRDARLAALAGETLLVDGDREALEIGPWNPRSKSLPVKLTSCIRCGGLEVEGRTWHVTGGAPARLDGRELQTVVQSEQRRDFADETAATAWATAVQPVRVEFLVKVPAPAKRRWRTAGKNGLALQIVGFRASTPCRGAVLVSNPPSSVVEIEKARCPAMPSGSTK